jgi:hypothetical protein
MLVEGATICMMPRHPAPTVGAAINTWFARRAVSPTQTIVCAAVACAGEVRQAGPSCVHGLIARTPIAGEQDG